MRKTAEADKQSQKKILKRTLTTTIEVLENDGDETKRSCVFYISTKMLYFLQQFSKLRGKKDKLKRKKM